MNKIIEKDDSLTDEQIEKMIFLYSINESNNSWRTRKLITDFVRLPLHFLKDYWKDLSSQVKSMILEEHKEEIGILLNGGTIQSKPSSDFNRIKDQCIKFGIERIFLPDYYNNRSKMQERLGELLISRRIESVLKILNVMTDASLLAFLKDVDKVDSSLFKLKEIDLKVSTIVNGISISNPNFHNHKQASLILYSLGIMERYGSVSTDWKSYYENLKSIVNQHGKTMEIFKEVAGFLISKDKNYILDDVNKVSFKSNRLPVRLGTYDAIIKAGLLTEKIARRIRSDTSEAVSTDSIKTLFKNIDLYSNKNELIGAFLDTRYPQVAYNLVKDLPEEYLPFLVGVKGSSARKLLESRMKKYAESERLKAKNLENKTT